MLDRDLRETFPIWSAVVLLAAVSIAAAIFVAAIVTGLIEKQANTAPLLDNVRLKVVQ